MAGYAALLQQLNEEIQRLTQDVAAHRVQKEFHAQKEAEMESQLKSLLDTKNLFEAKQSEVVSYQEVLPTSSIPEPQTVDLKPDSSNGHAKDNLPGLFDVPDVKAEIVPDELKKPQYANVGVIDAIADVAEKLGKPFKVDHIVNLIYNTNNEEEWNACRKSLTASLSRALAAERIKKKGRGVFEALNLSNDSNYMWSNQS